MILLGCFAIKKQIMRPHRKLVAWQESIEFVLDIYKLTKHFPDEEKFGLISQMRRAAVSIASNIAEGAARTSDKDKLKFYTIAGSSSSEIDTHLEICKKLTIVSEEEWQHSYDKLERVSALLNGLRKSIEKRLK